MTARHYGSIHLQGIGSFRAIRAGDLKAGDLTCWNYGHRQIVHTIWPAGKKSVAIVWRATDGTIYKPRTYREDRLIGFPVQPGERA